nr:EOG090X06YP [Sida crystallina]
MLWQIFAAITCAKVLFIPAYRSTDFEVHRNWLAVTHQLPIRKWYVDETSPWTLDYPPLFAWFEYGLSFLAQFFDPKMLQVQNLNYASERTILFQRLSVIVTDVIYAIGVQKCLSSSGTSKGSKMKWFSPQTISSFLLLCNVGLFIVDHIHFQYNGFLSGIFLLSIGCILRGQNLQSALWFSILLNLKHIYLYIAPAYFFYLLRSYCLEFRKSKWLIHWKRLFSLALIVISVFGVTFGPFVGQLDQVLSRLFPFKRGLCHAYWAPNFWALYNALDKLLVVASRTLNLDWVGSVAPASMTGGLVQEFEHQILPSVGPRATFICTLLACLPAVVLLFRRPNQPWIFVRAVVLCAFASFLFGWHVHEKAILMIIIPLTLCATSGAGDCRLFLLLSITGHVSLFPLLFTPFENVIKVVLVTGYSLASYAFLVALHSEAKSKRSRVSFSGLERAYLLGLLTVGFFECCLHSALGLNQRLPFLPLLTMSVYCAVGVVYVWILLMLESFQAANSKNTKQH